MKIVIASLMMMAVYTSNAQPAAKHSSYILNARYSPDGRQLVTSSDDGTAKIWEAATGRLMKNLETGGYQTVYSADGKLLASAGTDFNIWDIATGKKIKHIPRTDLGGIQSIEFSKDGRSLLAGEYHGFQVYDLGAGATLPWVWHGGNTVYSASYSFDGNRILTATVPAYGKASLKVWNSSGKQLQEFFGHTETIRKAIFFKDGNSILSVSHDSTAKVWSASGGPARLTLRGHKSWVVDGAVTPDGSKIITAAYDNTLRTWDARTGKMIHELRGHTEQVNSVNLSPDGKLAVTTSNDHRVIIWNVETGRQILTIDAYAPSEPDAIYSAFAESSLREAKDYAKWTPEKIRAAYEKLTFTAPDVRAVVKLADYVESQDATYYQYLRELAGVKKDEKDNVLGILKVRKYWNLYHDAFRAQTEGFNVHYGNVVKLAFTSTAYDFLTMLVSDYGADVLYKDKADGKNIMDFIKDEILRFEDSGQTERLLETRTRYQQLRSELGLRHSWEKVE